MATPRAHELLRCLLLLALPLAACAHHHSPQRSGPSEIAGASPSLPPAGWQSSVLLTHPLVGRIWDVAGQRFATREDLTGRLLRARFVLVGEKHDHPDHHVLEAALVRDYAGEGKHPALALEMVEPAQQGALDELSASRSQGADRWGQALDWDRSGWPPFTMYRPIFEAVAERSLPVFAANLPNKLVHAIAKGEAVPTDVVSSDALPLPPSQQTSLEQELVASHCGHLPAELAPRMARAQRARDEAMASVMLQKANADGVILLAGNGHVRNDRGVPFWLTQKDANARIVSIALLEVDEERKSPQAYASQFFTDTLPFDFVWFTPAAPSPDPCAVFKQRKNP